MKSDELGREVEEYLTTYERCVKPNWLKLLQAQQTEIKELQKALGIMYEENNRLRDKLKKGDGKK